MTRALAGKSASCPWATPSGTSAVSRICALVPVASVIWEATVRFQISSYRRSSSPDRPLPAGLLGREERLARRADGLVGLLGVLDLALVAAGGGGHVGVAVHLAG